MIARVDHVVHGPVAVLRLWLSPGGGKAGVEPQRKFTGPVGGGAVRLGALRPNAPLVIAEGIESALAAGLTPGLMMGCPAWAALSAGGIQALVLPDATQDIIIACDRDPSGVGERKARKAAGRWVREGRKARLVIPDRIGADPNDVLREARHVA
jgi:putative DNA primase/helicase